ncbi:P-loop NTPase [Leptospira sp. GIMC2001]|uniref:P-loop NTPase n=1 Tax=Leptospira sp. GIMC2001 TaxID=1513297 RepID=UPI00234A346D|nr:SIR2 family protein [Leptospira sp. GIMC2001]WCL51015.1 SIR2 family protein [Leptospira sp. GIMC2001]
MNYSEILRKIENRLESGIILFCGAGLSKDVTDQDSKNLPLGKELAEELWNLFPSIFREKFDNSTLRDIFNILQVKKPNELAMFLNKRFSVDSKSIKDYYKRYIEFPWHKIYTLNIDDLFEVLERKFNPLIRINPISGTRYDKNKTSYNTLDVVHLNGTYSDAPSDVIFSQDDYATHQGKGHPFYDIFATELNENMVVFIGSELDEEILWKHVSIRSKKTRELKESRPESYLVTPSIQYAKKISLEALNITHIPMTGEEFSNKILSKLEKTYIEVASRKRNRLIELKKEVTVPLVQDLILKKNKGEKRRHILLGFRPIWDDITSSRTIERKIEIELYQEVINGIVNPDLEYKTNKIFILSGNAGDGKTAILMRLAYKLSNEGINVGFIDPDKDFFYSRLKNIVSATEKIEILIIDDVHIYKEKLIPLLNEVIKLNKVKYIILACRSSRVDKVLKFKENLQAPLCEVFCQKLNDEEILDLLKLLESEQMLGALKGKNLSDQIEIIKSKQRNDRQLIVSLIEATSGKDLTELIKNEYSELDGINRKIYGILSIAQNYDSKLSSSELSIACDEKNLEYLNSLKKLESRGLIFKTNTGYFSLRHRVIARHVFEKVIEEGDAPYYFESIARMAAIVAIDSKMSRNKRIKSLARICLGHDRLIEITFKNITKINDMYENISKLYSENPHYWLQRAAVEIEIGELPFAKNHIESALALSPLDPLILITKYHIELKTELVKPYSDDSRDIFIDIIDNLKDMLPSRKETDPKPYHIIGNLGLQWANQKISIKNDKKVFLISLKEVVHDGLREFPSDSLLKELNEELQRSILMCNI